MSSLAIIYDKPGVDHSSLLGNYSKIRELIDEKKHSVEYFSQTENVLDDPRIPVSLFVVPDGSYKEMRETLEPLAPRIHDLVVKQGAGYLGLGAGAVAACNGAVLLNENPLSHRRPLSLQDLKMNPELQNKIPLKLYDGNCCLTSFEEQLAQKVKMASKNLSFDIFVRDGLFFPNAEDVPGAVSVMQYEEYPCELRGAQYYLNKKRVFPVAAVEQKVGNGRIVLSGVHPEIDSQMVEEAKSLSNSRWDHPKMKAIPLLKRSSQEQKEALADFLKILSIGLKV